MMPHAPLVSSSFAIWQDAQCPQQKAAPASSRFVPSIPYLSRALLRSKNIPIPGTAQVKIQYKKLDSPSRSAFLPIWQQTQQYPKQPWIVKCNCLRVEAWVDNQKEYLHEPQLLKQSKSPWFQSFPLLILVKTPTYVFQLPIFDQLLLICLTVLSDFNLRIAFHANLPIRTKDKSIETKCDSNCFLLD